MLHTAARIVTLSMKHQHITPILHMLHWLPVEQQIHFKLLLTTFNALSGQAPNYITYLLKLIEEYRPSRSLRSDNCLFLILTWFIMEGELLVMQSPGSGITFQYKYKWPILNQNSKTNPKLTCLNHIIIVRQSLSMTTDSLLILYSTIGHIVGTGAL